MAGLSIMVSDVRERVAWAKMYEERARCDKLLANNLRLLEKMADLCTDIAECEALQVLDCEGDVVRKAHSIIAAMRLSTRGQIALANVRTRRQAAA